MATRLIHLDGKADFFLRNGRKRTNEYAAEVSQEKIGFYAKKPTGFSACPGSRLAGE